MLLRHKRLKINRLFLNFFFPLEKSSSLQCDVLLIIPLPLSCFLKVTEKPERDWYVHGAGGSSSVTAAGRGCLGSDASPACRVSAAGFLWSGGNIKQHRRVRVCDWNHLMFPRSACFICCWQGENKGSVLVRV